MDPQVWLPPTSRTLPHSLAPMLEARSVAVVGASKRPGSFSERLMIELVEGGFEGDLFPVNPRYEELFGLRCHATIADVPGPVDLVILALPNAALEEQLAAAASVGARSAVIFASCYEEPVEGRPPLTERLARIAREAGMAICGGNCMGFINFERRLRACGYYEPRERVPGPITLISHSGSVFSALLHNRRGLEFNLAVSPGNELTTTLADYMLYALGLESTRAIALFLETVRDPPSFRSALEQAAEREIPVVALKVGREERAREMVAAHSGALAGEDAAYEALFDAHGVLRVESLDEMADTLSLLLAGRPAGPGGLASLHDSGGERAMFIDAAASVGVRFAQISPATRDQLAALLEEGLPPVNPVDAWGSGYDVERIYLQCMRTLLADPDTAALAFVVDLTTEIDPRFPYSSLASTIFSETSKPVAVISNFREGIDPDAARRIREAGVPLLEGTSTGLAAFRHLFAYRDIRTRPPLRPEPPPPDDVRERWRNRLASGEPLSEVEGLALLSDYGIPTVRAAGATTLADALAEAERLGWPVAIKTAVPGVSHKSEAGGVKLGLRGPADLEQAYRDLAARLGPEVTVAAMAPPGVELALGVVRDPQFGPMVMVAAGGILVEVLRDRRFGLPPLDRTRALAMLDALLVRRLLDGVRGIAPADIEAVASAVTRLSTLTLDLGDLVAALDVNPLIAGPHGALAVDALVVPRQACADQERRQAWTCA